MRLQKLKNTFRMVLTYFPIICHAIRKTLLNKLLQGRQKSIQGHPLILLEVLEAIVAVLSGYLNPEFHFSTGRLKITIIGRRVYVLQPMPTFYTFPMKMNLPPATVFQN